MPVLCAVEVEPEVRSWLERLSDRDFGRADFLTACSRFHLLAQQARITCWKPSTAPRTTPFDWEAS